MKLLDCIIVVFVFFVSVNVCNAQWDVLPDRMWEDEVHAPFKWGVSSGDPLPNGVIIWTRFDGGDETTIVNINWEVATDSTFINVVNSGESGTGNYRDWTVKVDVANLNPYTDYYYRFLDSAGNSSAVGRTKTAPNVNTDVEELKFAIASCSSIYSGYFNAYKKISERNDLDLMIHLGDYIYDFVDSDEQVRIPEPFPKEPVTKEEFWQRHRYYLLDPDLRAARQMHPWMALWDNHDINKDNEEVLIGSLEAFFDYLPIRRPDENNVKQIYRSLKYGKLADLCLVDIELLRNQEEIPGTGEQSLLSEIQSSWLRETIENSTAQWRIIGNQKLFAQWFVEHITVPIPFGDGQVADPGAWDGYPTERNRLLDFIRDNSIDNNIVVSGDIHLSIASDLVKNPIDQNEYNPSTGDGSIAVEFVPPSITRGNVDELLGIEVEPEDLQGLVNISNQGNPHHKFLEFSQHGYGVLTLNRESAIAQYQFVPKNEVSNEEESYTELICYTGENKWSQSSTNVVDIKLDSSIEMIVHPNPIRERGMVSIKGTIEKEIAVFVVGINGELHIENLYTGKINKNQELTFEVNMENLLSGTYLICVNSKEGSVFKKLIKQ